MYGSHSLGISMALCTRVSWPARSSASCRARAFMTVPSIPMWSDWVASMPDMAPVRPRQKLPPPTTTHTSTSISRTAMISFAVVSRVAASRPWPDSPASASPDGLKTIRFHRGNSTDDIRRSADLDLSEADDRRRADHLRDRLLVVFGIRLVEESDILVETVEAALDDLRQRRFRLALVPTDRLQRLSLVCDDLGRNIVATEVLRPGEGDVHGDVVRQRLRRVAHLHEHGVDAATALDVQVAVEHVARRSLEPNDLAELDLLLEGDFQVFELRGALRHGIFAFGDHQLGQGVRFRLELVAAGDEVGLALELDDGADVALDDQGNKALVVLAVVTLGAGRQTLLTEPLLRSFHVAVVRLEGFLGVHHPRASGLAQRLYVFRCECHVSQPSVSVSGASTVSGVSTASTGASAAGASTAGDSAVDASAAGMSCADATSSGASATATAVEATRASRSAWAAAAWRRASACEAEKAASSS